MGLEAEVKQLIWQAVSNQAATMDALLSDGAEIALTDAQLMQEVILPTLGAHGEALTRIARAVDELIRPPSS